MAKKKTKKQLPVEIAARLGEAVKALRESNGQEDIQRLFDQYAVQLPGYEDDLILALAKIRHPQILQFLYRLSQKVSDKKRQKALRKAVYSLEQAGLSADGLDRPPKESLIKPRAALAPLGYLTGFEPYRGLRSGLLALPASRERYDTALFLCTQAEGLIQFGGGQLTQGQVQKHLSNIGAVAETGLIKATPRAVRYVLSEACQRSRQKGFPFDEEDYEAFMTQAGSKVTLSDRPPIYDHISPEGLLDRVDIESASTRLFDHVFFNGLRAGEELLPYLPKLDQVQTSVLVLSEAQHAERRMAVIEDAVRDLFTPDKKWGLKRQLEEIAYLLFLSDETGLAEETLAVALDLADKETWANHPFIRSFMLISIDFFAQDDHHPDPMSSDRETTRLPSGRSPSGRSPSGLILPGAAEPGPTEPGMLAPGMHEDES